ncbi:la-related protein 1B-like isoform X1 [Hordeum vulgare subsp. vulgare]|uniref:HTH La-type RNA-binding domain-containing protein n=1 Tax=Hordeum vulgare subsp. vulgare TaxID=112509 RepID=A0A8I6Y3H1_HORVV|nr:la-related protein 1B-like isoform X1 [Hordeum vulgare subsp. vulgare]
MASVAADPQAALAGAGTPPHSGSPVAAKRAAATAWKRPENGPVLVAPGSPIMDADSWPALPGLASPQPPTPPKASPKATPPPSTVVAMILPVSLDNSGAPDAIPDKDALAAVISPVSLDTAGAPDATPDKDALISSLPVRRVLMMPAGDDSPDMHAPVPELSPGYSPNARSNGTGVHHQNGRVGSHSHGRGGSYGGGSRRGNGGGGSRHGHEHHAGFDGQRRGGGRRDGHGPGHQHRVHQPSYIRAPPSLAVLAAGPPAPPFAGPATPQTPPYGTAAPQTPPYGAPMGFPAEMAPHVYYFAVPTSDGLQTLPFAPPTPTPPAMLISPLEQLQRELLVQIDYYFSDENLCKDIFLRGHMDDHGWVPLSLIAGFNKVQRLLYRIGQVKNLTNGLQFILDTVMQSTVVEVQGDKIRRRVRWEVWLLPRSNYSAGIFSGSRSPVTSNIDSLASQFQSVGLEGTYYPREALLTRSATSVSIGYQAPTFRGLHSNGSGPIFGQQTERSLLRSDTF